MPLCTQSQKGLHEGEGAFVCTFPKGLREGEGASEYTVPKWLRVRAPLCTQSSKKAEDEGETEFMGNLKFENLKNFN